MPSATMSFVLLLASLLLLALPSSSAHRIGPEENYNNDGRFRGRKLQHSQSYLKTRQDPYQQMMTKADLNFNEDGNLANGGSANAVHYARLAKSTRPPTRAPTRAPTDPPSRQPTDPPSRQPTDPPSRRPTNPPSRRPTNPPSRQPTDPPSRQPTDPPSRQPIDPPSRRPTGPPVDASSPVRLTYQPGDFSNNQRSVDNKLRLSNGLTARPIAQTGKYVQHETGGQSSIKFHINPDGAAIIEKQDNSGGYYYVSNAENETVGTNWWNGGVGSIEFNREGEVVGYKRVASRLRMNCGGGVTPWNSWVTCEEIDYGRVYQVDPSGEIRKTLTDLGISGAYESFAYDDETDVPTFYVTRDSIRGALTRFTPNAKGMECYNKVADADRWCTLSHGTKDYLLISGGPSGTFEWVSSERVGRDNAKAWYPNSEGIDVVDGMLYTTSKRRKQLMILNLRTMEYTYESTQGGAFDQQPDQVARLVDDADSILYFCEDGGKNKISPGVHGRSVDGRYFTIIEGRFPTADETTGLAYSASGHHMYVSYQKNGIIYDITREDGLPFHGAILDIKYHAMQDQ